MAQFITLQGLADYRQTLELMENHVSQLINKSVKETIYLVEHADIYTAGTSFKSCELLDSEKIPVIYTGRGGRFTYHGAGQRVIYPILDLSAQPRQKDIKLYIRMLEEWLINSLAYFAIKAFTVEDRVGIWVKDQGREAKIAAIGVRIKKWVTYHGMAVNIVTDLSKFSGIIACGLNEFPVTSMAKLGVDIEISQFDEVVEKEFARVFG